eukprot:540360-Pyramimonas_sp.AAC.1
MVACAEQAFLRRQRRASSSSARSSHLVLVDDERARGLICQQHGLPLVVGKAYQPRARRPCFVPESIRQHPSLQQPARTQRTN